MANPNVLPPQQPGTFQFVPSFSGTPAPTTLASAYLWTLPQVKLFIDHVGNNATRFVDANGGAGDPVDLARAAQDLSLAIAPNRPANNPIRSVIYPNDLTDSRLAFKYCGVEIRSTTLYDTLAYLLSSISTLPPNRTPQPEKEYFFPLVTVYAKWCNMLATHAQDANGVFMYHIAYFGTPGTPGTKVFLGSTIGSNPAFRNPIKDARATQMSRGPDPTAIPPIRSQPLVSTGDRFGGCAESNFFIFARRFNLPPNGASGFAFNVNHNQAFPPQYDPQPLQGWLANPCAQSCQGLFTQLGFAGNQTFRIGRIQNALNAGSIPPQNQPPLPPGPPPPLPAGQPPPQGPPPAQTLPPPGVPGPVPPPPGSQPDQGAPPPQTAPPPQAAGQERGQGPPLPQGAGRGGPPPPNTFPPTQGQGTTQSPGSAQGLTGRRTRPTRFGPPLPQPQARAPLAPMQNPMTSALGTVFWSALGSTFKPGG